jgi:hypothetical protein
MSDLKQRQAEYRQFLLECRDPEYRDPEYREWTANNFDHFMHSPLFLEMKAAFERIVKSAGLQDHSSFSYWTVNTDVMSKAREVLSQLTESEGEK